MADLKHSVILRESVNKLPVSFAPGDDLPDWAVEQLENSPHLFEDDVAPEPVAPVEIPKPADQKPITGQVPGAGPLTEPAATELGKPEVVDENEAPKRNASERAWRLFAEGQGVPVTEDMDRSEIIKACEEAGVVDAR